MDSLKELFEQKRYETILSLTEKSEDGESLFYRASSLLALGKSKEAMELFSTHRKTLFAYHPLATLKHNFELRILLNEFEEAYLDYDEFKNYPYVSQEVEEKIRAIPSYLRQKERESFNHKPLSVEEAKKILSSPKGDYETLATLEAISHVAIDPFLPEIKTLLISSIHPSVKTYAFLLLINCGYDQEVTLVKGNSAYHLIPKNTKPPFVGLPFKNVKQELESLAKDPSVSGVAYSLFSDYTLALFPSSPFDGVDEKQLVYAFLSLAFDYLKRENGSLPFEESGVKNEIVTLKKKISSLLNSIPPLSE